MTVYLVWRRESALANPRLLLAYEDPVEAESYARVAREDSRARGFEHDFYVEPIEVL